VLASSADFYIEANRRIYEAMNDLASNGKAIDPVTLGSRLKERGDLEKVGGAMAVSLLLDGTATAVNAGHYAGIVRDKAAVRRMIYASQEIAAKGYASVDNVDEYLAECRKSITIASISGTISGVAPVSADLSPIVNELSEGKLPQGIIKTGIDKIDNLTGGLWPRLMTVVGGRPGMGKSALVLNIATNVAKQGKKVMYVTLEDDRRLVALRLLSRFGDVDLANLMVRSVPDGSWPKIISAVNDIHDIPLYIDDSAALSSDQIHQRAALQHQMTGLDLLIVDHLGEVAEKGESMSAMTEAAAKGIRNIAKELNIPVLLAVQLNRDVERRTDKRPTLQDLRQSGAIEQVARFVWFMYRRGYYERGCEDDPDTQIIVAKSSHGKTGTIRLWSDLSRMYIRGWDMDVDGPFPEDGSGKYAKPHTYGVDNQGKKQDRRLKFFGGDAPADDVAEY
jgi:replicative DNA helicase